MAKQNLIQSLPICSKCLVYEINNWIADKNANLNPEVTQQVREELKAIKLKPGKCIVCNHDSVSHETSENILKILQKSNSDKKIIEEFKKFFCFSI